MKNPIDRITSQKQIYTPNTNQKEFYHKLHQKIIESEQENVCLIGDFNAVVDTKKDYSSNKKRRKEEHCQTHFSKWYKS